MSRADLSKRERRVLLLAAAGCTNKQIASRLGVTEATVKFHFANVLRKLGAGSRTEAASLALARRLIRSPHALGQSSHRSDPT